MCRAKYFFLNAKAFPKKLEPLFVIFVTLIDL